MGKQYHFVVMYDTDTKRWETEPTISINFDTGDVWNEETQDWEVNVCESDEEQSVTDAIGRIMNEAPPVEIVKH